MITISLFDITGRELHFIDSVNTIEQAIIAAYYILAKDYMHGNYVLVSVTDEDGEMVVTKMTNEG